MFQIDFNDNGEIVCCGRLDAAQCEKAQAFMDAVADNQTLNFATLDYISSAGLGVLLKTQKRLVGTGGAVLVCCANDDILSRASGC